MEQLLDTSKGMHIDYHPISQPNGTYTYLLNAIRSTSGAIENEKGTSKIDSFKAKKIVGATVLNREIILFLFPSEIGVLDPSDVYKTITTNTALGFKATSNLSVQAKNNFKGDRIVYLAEEGSPMRTINLDDTELLTSPTFADDTKLQITPVIPEITVDEVVDGGTLTTGVYQATARLLTKSTNAAPFGFVSPLVPIIDESSSAAFNDIDGANPQTPSSKAIRFTVSNIDTAYEFLQIAIVTYVGTANVSNAYVVATLPIEGRTSISFTYSSNDQHKESVDLSSIAIKPIVYDSAKILNQKDGILVASNLTASKEIFDFQPIANKVKLKYTIEEIPWQPGYKNELTAALKKGYMRGEVYSFSIAPIFISSYNTTAYHVPGRQTNQSVNTTTKELGVYTSLEEYPLERGFPTGDRKVRHHIMPSLTQEPSIVKRNGVVYLRVLGVEADFSEVEALIPAETKKNLRGFSILRQVRTDNQKSILGQGLASVHLNNITGLDRILSPFGKVMYGINTGFTTQLSINTDQIGFFSPESIIYQDNFIGANQITPVAEITGSQKIIADKRTGDNKFAYILSDYDNMLAPSIQASAGITSGTVQYVDAGNASANFLASRVTLTGVTNTVNNYKNTGYLYMKLARELPMRQEGFNGGGNTTTSGQIPEFWYANRANSTDLIFLNGQEKSVNQEGTTNRFIYNVTRSLPRQYGSILEAKYIYCDNWKFGTEKTKKFYGGDTFISKFAFISSTEANTVEFKNLSYFFVESEINTNYRHYKAAVGKEGDDNYEQGTTPYYPKYTPLYEANSANKPGLFNVSFSLGHSRGYNKQYSFENSIVQFFPRQLAEEQVSNFSNRSIYSEQSIEGEQLDAYRIFLPNNYHDIPKHKGEITNTFVHNGTFYHHTSGSLWQSFFNEKVTQASSIGEVYLGTGGVFTRPSIEVFAIDGGYAGTQGFWGVSTPFGYYFVDARQKKIFNLGKGLEDISEQGMSNFFDLMEETHDFNLVFDYEHNRLLITSNQDWTLSYQMDLKSWSSFHSYIPYFMISRGKSVYMAKDLELHSLNKGEYGMYFGEYQPLQLEYIVNVSADATKSFDNVVVHSSTYDMEDIPKLYESFTDLKVYNEDKDTSPLTIKIPLNFEEEWEPLGINEVLMKRKDNEFRLATPVDLLANPSERGVYVDNQEFRPRMTGKWMKFRWTFNRKDRRFLLHTIKTKIKGVPR
jgi:hypothetical protein